MFKLNEKINNDTFEICDLDLCTVRLMNDQQYPWVILIPKRADITEIHHLANEDQIKLMAEISVTSQILEDLFKPTSLNVAALGNVVNQLHVHVVARFVNDATWPGPIWGQPCVAYEDKLLVEKVRKAFNLLNSK
jgi:diadenosine tetraphosphate (Ap4A) HIT family hydrolase